MFFPKSNGQWIGRVVAALRPKDSQQSENFTLKSALFRIRDGADTIHATRDFSSCGSLNRMQILLLVAFNAVLAYRLCRMLGENHTAYSPAELSICRNRTKGNTTTTVVA